MTVQELKFILEDLPPQMQVVVSRDSEGNDYGKVAEWGLGHFKPRVYGKNFDGFALVFTDQETCAEQQLPLNCLCLWPDM